MSREYQPEYFDNKQEQNKIKQAILDALPTGVEYYNLIAAMNELQQTFILHAFKKGFQPTVWDGALADILEKGLVLISQLKNHQNSAISTWARNEEKAFAEEIERERQWENESNRTQDERFE